MLDEADEMLDLNFREESGVYSQDTRLAEHRTLPPDAPQTLPRGIVAPAKNLSSRKPRLPIEVDGGEGGHTDIQYHPIRVAVRDH